MSEHQEVFGITELEMLGCACRQCDTEIVFKISTATYTENKCPNCGASLFPLDKILAGSRVIYKDVAEAKLHVRLRSAPSSETKTK